MTNLLLALFTSGSLLLTSKNHKSCRKPNHGPDAIFSVCSEVSWKPPVNSSNPHLFCLRPRPFWTVQVSCLQNPTSAEGLRKHVIRVASFVHNVHTQTVTRHLLLPMSPGSPPPFWRRFPVVKKLHVCKVNIAITSRPSLLASIARRQRTFGRMQWLIACAHSPASFYSCLQ